MNKEQIKKMIAEKLLKQSKRYKQELITLKRQMRNMVNSHKNELTSMETDKDERIRILHEHITELNRERCQIEDDLTHKLDKSKTRIHQLKARLSKSSSKNIMKLEGVIITLNPSSPSSEVTSSPRNPENFIPEVTNKIYIQLPGGNNQSI